jgi:hypothetical protein
VTVSIPGARAAGQRLAAQLMVDTCRITRTTGTTTHNPTTGRLVPAVSTVYEGRCQVRVPTSTPETPEAAGRTATVQDAIVKVPLAVTGVEVGDTITVLTAAHDPELVGRTFRVAGTHAKTYATARKLAVEETTA